MVWLVERRQTMLNMSISSSRGGISRMLSSHGTSIPASTLVQSSMRTSCRELVHTNEDFPDPFT